MANKIEVALISGPRWLVDAYPPTPESLLDTPDVEALADWYTEQMAEVERRVEDINEAMAQRFLTYCRKEVAQFNTGRHEIRIVSGMGPTNLRVGQRWVQSMQGRGPLFELLRHLDELLYRSPEWAGNLDGERLNEPRDDAELVDP